MRLFTACCVCLFFTETLWADTLNVPDDYDTIQQAINASSPGDLILVAPGTYTGTSTSPVVSLIGRSLTIQATGSPEETILDGEDARGVIRCIDNSTAGSSTITGFTITGGSTFQGGGIYYASSGGLTISQCIITQNSATGSFTSAFPGGGIFLADISRGFEVSDSTITENTASVGGGIFCNSLSNPTISNCFLLENVATDDAGSAIYCNVDSMTVITDCIIANHDAVAIGTYSAAISDTFFCGNTFDVVGTWSNNGGNEFIDTCSPTIDGVLEVPDEYPTIQSAIDASSNGDIVLVAPGTYTGTGSSVIDPSGKAITIRASGSADDTILDGEGERDVVYCGSSEGMDTVIQGFTITNGGGTFGYGVFCQAGSPTISQCRITQNLVNSGLFTKGTSNPTLVNTSLCENRAPQVYGPWTNGGDVCIASLCDDNDSDGIPDQCQGSIGDGVHEVPSEYPTIQAAINIAGYGDTVLVSPGTYTSADDAVVNTDCKPITIRSSGTAAETILAVISGSSSVVRLVGGEGPETIIDGFTITGGTFGGISCYLSDPTITNCVIESNVNTYDGGGISCRDSSPTVSQCTIQNNTARTGAGVYTLGNSSPAITSCSILNNTSSDSDGAAVASAGANPTITDTRICGNTPFQISGTWTDGEGNSIEDECGPAADGTLLVPQEYATIQEAIDDAFSGDEILVAPGTYTGSGTTVVNLNGKSVTLRATGTREETILDGEGERRVVQCTDSEGPDTVIQGFTIRGGNAPVGGGIDTTAGGGISLWLSNPTIVDCLIYGNEAEIGGGVSCIQASPTITECAIFDNTATYGGGLYAQIGSNPVLTHCDVCSNSPDQIDGTWDDTGGNTIEDICAPTVDGILEVPAEYATIQAAIDAASNGDHVLVAPGTYYSPSSTGLSLEGKAITLQATGTAAETILDGAGFRRVIDCSNGEGPDTVIDGFTIANGDTDGYGGGILCASTSPTIRNCVITDNSAGSGGGIASDGNPTLLNCTVTNNSAVQGGGFWGGQNGAPVLSGCTIQDNTANTFGGGVYLFFCLSDTLITDCTISGNATLASTSGLGGGLYIRGGSQTVTNCAITGNASAEHGGGVYLRVAGVTFTNCVLLDNVAAMDGGGIYLENTASVQDITSCTISNNLSETGGAGIHNEDDNPSTAPRLTETTVCDNDPVQIFGYWTDNGGNAVQDQCPSDCVGDINGDAIVDGADLAQLLGAWLSDNPSADLNGDGTVDGADLTLLLGAWGLCP